MESIEDQNKKFMECITHNFENILSENSKLKDKNNIFENHIINLETSLNSLKLQLENSQEEQRELLKVSRVIAVEKENTRLKQENETLKEKLNQLQKSTKQEKEEQQEPNIKKVKIKGTNYFVIDNEVFVQNTDGTKGDLVGTLDGKKVIWK